MIYVASPYTHHDRRIQEHRFLMAEFITSQMLAQRTIAFSPIVYAHRMAEKYDLPTDAEFWKFFNNSIMRRSESIVVLKLYGWEASHGVAHEISLAQELDIPILYYAVKNETLPEGCVL